MTEYGWGKYAETVLIFATEPQIFVDVRAPVSPNVRDQLRSLGTDGGFAIVTACNPNGQNLSDEENDRRQARLEAELTRSGERFVRIDACSLDRSHCERSIALAVPLERAIDIAKQYEQLAVFWFDGMAFWIKPAISNLWAVRLPTDRVG